MEEFGFDFERRNDDLPGWPYAVLKGNRVIGRAKTARQAAIFAWGMAVNGVLTDQKIIDFMAAVTGLMKLSGDSLSPKKTQRREGDKRSRRK